MDMLALDLGEFWVRWARPALMFLIGLGAVIFVHELGHFLMGRWVGIRVDVFSLGMGPRLFGFRRKETDYRIGMIPFGGYVKMLGQEDFAPLKGGDSDPRSLANKSVGARFSVFASGVVMNIIFAALAFIAIGLIGKNFAAPVVGGVLPDSPAAGAKITWGRPAAEAETVGLVGGDRILTLNGKPVTRFDQLRLAAVLADADDVFDLTIERQVDGQVRLGRTRLGLRWHDSPTGSGGQLLQFGLYPARDLRFAHLDNYVLPEDGLEGGDRVEAINGEPIAHHWQLSAFEAKLDGSPVTVTVARSEPDAPEPSRVELTVQPAPIMNNPSYQIFFTADGSLLRATGTEKLPLEEGKQDKTPRLRLTLLDGEEVVLPEDELQPAKLMDVLGLVPRMQVVAVERRSPAGAAGLLPGDIIVGYGGRSAPTKRRFLSISRDFVGRETYVVVLRSGQTLAPLAITPKMMQGRALVGIVDGIDLGHLVVAGVRKNSPADRTGLRAGDVITDVNDRPVRTWVDLLTALKDLGGEPLTLGYRRGVHASRTAVGTLSEDIFGPQDYRFVLFYGPERFGLLEVTIRWTNPLKAVAWGVQETGRHVGSAYLQLEAMLRGSVSVRELQGPVGIADIAIRVARESAVDFIYFMAFLSVIVAVVNFLPLPVFDGGHAALLLLEKIRGRPLSVRVMNIVQMVGLVLIIGLFLAVTWQDIMRLVQERW